MMKDKRCLIDEKGKDVGTWSEDGSHGLILWSKWGKCATRGCKGYRFLAHGEPHCSKCADSK